MTPIDALLSDLAGRLSLPGLRLDMAQSCAIVVGGETQVDLHYAPAEAVLGLCAEVLTPHDPARARIVRAALSANLQPSLLEGFFFALQAHTPCVSLCRTLDAETLDGAQLLAEIARLVAACRGWRSRLSEPGCSLA